MKRIVASVVLLGWIWVGLPNPGDCEESPFHIGVLVCLTGECAEWGSNSVKGIELAVEEINSAGGVLGKKLEIQVQDTAEGSGGAGAVTAFHQLLRNGDIRYFIGPSWTTGGLSVAPIGAQRNDIIITSPSIGVANFNESADHMFNVWPHDEFATIALAEYAAKKGWAKAAIFSSQQPWESAQGDAFESEFKRLNGVVTVKEEPLPSILDLRAEALRVKQGSPDVVFLSNFNQMGIAARQLRQAGYTGPLLAILMDDSRIQAAEGALEGAVFARYPDPAETFAQEFTKLHGVKPGITADTAYDTVKLYSRAITEGKTFDVNDIKVRMLRIRHEGASGTIEFDAKGGVKKDPVLYIVRRKEMTPLS